MVRHGMKAVHGNVTALLNAGLLQRAPGGGVVFPCDAVKVVFFLRRPKTLQASGGRAGQGQPGAGAEVASCFGPRGAARSGVLFL